MYLAENKKTKERKEFTWLENNDLIIDHAIVNVDDWEIIEVIDGRVMTADGFEDEPTVMKKVTGHLMNELWELYEESGQSYDTDGGFTSYEDMCQWCTDNDLDLVEVFDYEEDESNPPYIVCWLTKKVTPRDVEDLVEYTDHYRVFTDVIYNMNAAMNFYNTLLEGDDVYSANVCQVIRSTDYEC